MTAAGVPPSKLSVDTHPEGFPKTLKQALTASTLPQEQARQSRAWPTIFPASRAFRPAPSPQPPHTGQSAQGSSAVLCLLHVWQETQEAGPVLAHLLFSNSFCKMGHTSWIVPNHPRLQSVVRPP